MSKPKTTEERVGILEEWKQSYPGTQNERHKDVMKRVERLENKFVGALGGAIVLGILITVNIIVTLLKR